MAVLLALSAFMHLWGIRKDLPYVPDLDEPEFVYSAVRIVSTGSFHPRIFGHPGSTVIYPLAIVYHLRNVIFNNGPLFKADSKVVLRFDENDSAFYYIGRIIAILWNVATLFMLFGLGRDLYNDKIGLMAAGLYLNYQLAIAQSQLVRTDSVATFFGILGLRLIIRLYSDPKLVNQVLVGIVIGLGIASRYFMALLIPVYLIASIAFLVKTRPNQNTKTITVGVLLGLMVIFITFFAVTPFFLLDFHTAVENILREARVVHGGADNLSPLGNMGWYLFNVFPASVTWIQMIFAIVGIAIILTKKYDKALLGVLLFFVFFAGVCAQHLHWARWIVELLPLFALFTAVALDKTVEWAMIYFNQPKANKSFYLVLAVVAVSILPAINTIKYNVSQARYSTRIDMYRWILKNVPFGSHIANEWYTAPLLKKNYVNIEKNTLSDVPLDEYKKEGYEYLLVGSMRFNLFLNNPTRYEREAAFYRSLFAESTLIKTVLPKPGQAGPEIRLYKLNDGENDNQDKNPKDMDNRVN
ncbi:MAG: glycosyltransferase family 39 protein [candidate division FCPU426 bacterium]